MIVLVVVAVELVLVIYLLWVIAYNQTTTFGRHWTPQWWWDRRWRR